MEIQSQLTSGQLASLIPSISDSKKEEKATSIVLASFMAVPEFADRVLKAVGASVSKRSKVKCYTEVVFKDSPVEADRRPDGLIIIETGNKVWCALVESKIGRAQLQKEQIDSYLTLAKQLKIDAVITLSNQFAASPKHHPVKISSAKTRSVELFHFSWLAIKSIATILVNEKQIGDHDQAYILSEVVRYLDSVQSGVETFSKMPSTWKDLCSAIQNDASIGKNSEMVVQSVGAWHQLMRQLALDLSISIGQLVELYLSRENKRDPSSLLLEGIDSLRKTGCLNTDLMIPDAASKLKVSADIARKVVFVSMKIDAPKDTKRATASINWLLRQLKNKDSSELSVRAYWSRRSGTTIESLEAVRQNPSILIPEGMTQMPVSLEVCRVVDLGARFKGAKTFIEDISGVIPAFYQDAGQELRNWVPKAPKLKVERLSETKEKEQNNSPTIFSKFIFKG